MNDSTPEFPRAIAGRSSESATMCAAEAKTGQQPASSHLAEKRGEVRYRCEGSAEFRTVGIDVRTWARVTDLSRSGCYVEMQATSPLHTAVNLMIEVNGLRVHAKAVVKTSYSLQGMGIAFTEIPDEDRPHLEEILRQLALGTSPTLEPKSPAPDLLMIIDPGTALNAIAKFFQSTRNLSREEFKELVATSQDRSRRDR